MNERVSRCVIVGLLLSFSFNHVSLGFFFKKQTKTEKLVAAVKRLGQGVKSKYNTLKSSKLVQRVMCSVIIATAIYLFQFLGFAFAANDFADAPPEVKNMFDQMAKDIGIQNPEKINLKLTRIRYRYKSFWRKASEWLILLPLFRMTLEGSMGCTGPAGNVYISPDMIKSYQRARFILGHELSHVKHKDVFWGFVSGLVLDIALGEYLANWSFKAVKVLGRILHSQVIGKFFEVRADLTAASLDRDTAEAGAQFFEEFQAKENAQFRKLSPKKQGRVMMNKILFDPHPLTCLRAKYLRWYKAWKYS